MAIVEGLSNDKVCVDYLWDGFACDDFKQENALEEKAAEICFINYGVTFTMLAPTKILGSDANVTFNALALSTQAPVWNFNKYLVSADGTKIQYFGSKVEPNDPLLIDAIHHLLIQPAGK